MKTNEQMSYTQWRNNTLAARMETNKKYVVLKMGSTLISTGGLGWYILYTLLGIRFAVENNYIPVVDWKNCKLPQYDADKVGKENVWEYYFEQPFHISLEEAYKSDNFFIIDDVSEMASMYRLDIEKFVDFFNQDTMEWRRYFQHYIRIKRETKEYFESLRMNQIVNSDKNIVGILARGTDYKELRPVGHLSPIAIGRIFDEIAKLSNEIDIAQIFLATEDQCILQEFKKRYSGKICSVETKRYGTIGRDTLNIIYKDEDGYERDLKYLYSLYVISKCPIGIYAACGGGAIAALMRDAPGLFYKFLCEGHNRAKAILVGSYIEKKDKKVAFMGNKPIMFYALNTLKLLQVKEVDIIVTNGIKEEYQKLIGTDSKCGMKINYIVSDTYNVVEYMKSNQEFMTTSKLILLYTDFFVHGRAVLGELVKRVNAFDGAFVWGVKNYYSDDTESIQINRNSGMPQKAYSSFVQGNYSLMGRYVFDHDLVEIVESSNDITDILNEYIKRKKLFFIEYKRGIVYSKIIDEDTLVKVGQMINLLEEIQENRIGDFMAF